MKLNLEAKTQPVTTSTLFGVHLHWCIWVRWGIINIFIMSVTATVTSRSACCSVALKIHDKTTLRVINRAYLFTLRKRSFVDRRWCTTWMKEPPIWQIGWLGFDCRESGGRRLGEAQEVEKIVQTSRICLYQCQETRTYERYNYTDMSSAESLCGCDRCVQDLTRYYVNGFEYSRKDWRTSVDDSARPW